MTRNVNDLLYDADAVIGFLNPPYTVSEGDGSAVLQVGVIKGSILGEVMVGLSTSDLTAVGILFLPDYILLQ